MGIDLEDRHTDPEAESPNESDDVFKQLTAKEHMAKDGTSGELSGGPQQAGSDGESVESPEALAGAESGAGSASQPADAPASPQAVAGGYLKRFLWGSKGRKAATIGGGFGLGLGAAAFFFVFTVGPFELVHLSQLLSHDFSKTQSDSEDRNSHLLRYAVAYKNKDFRYTRVGPIGAKLMNKAVAAFEDAGIKFAGADALGRPTEVTIDRSRLENKFPETKGMKDAQLKGWLNEKFSTTGFRGSGKNINLNIRGLNASAMTKLISNSRVSLIGDGKIPTAIKTRSLKKFFGLGSLFHPFSRAIEDKIAARAAAAEKTRQKGKTPAQSPDEIAVTTEQQTFAERRAPIEQPGLDKFKDVKGKSDGITSKIVGKAGDVFGYVWVTGCVLKGAGDAIVVMNRNLDVLPAAVEATTLTSAGSEVEYGGKDTGMRQVGGTVGGFTNNQGQDIWTAPALMTLGGGASSSFATNRDGSIKNDLPDEYKQAFGDQTSSNNIKDTGNLLLDAIGLNEIHGLTSKIPGVKKLTDPCGLVAAVTITAVGLAFKGISIAAAPETGGGSIALKWTITRGAEESVKFALGAKLLGFITNKIVHSKAAPRLAADAFSGPIGGGLIAFGAREAGNLTAIAGGGIALANNTSTIIGSAGEEEQQQFKSESYFARLFDIKDSRSLVGHLSMSIRPNVRGNLLSALSNFQNIGGSLTHVFGSLIPGVSAAGNNDSWTGNYDWGFPQFGIPDSMLNDPDLKDPYQNLETVGQYLSTVCTDGTTIGTDKGACASGKGGGYTERIKTCFGNDLTYSDDASVGGKVWDVAVASNTDVDPNSDAYQNAACGDIGDQNWKRIIMFANDTHNIKASDCFLDDSDTSQQSCIDEGMDDGTTAPDTTNTTAGVTIDTTQLSEDSTNVACANNTKDLGIQDGYTDGKKVAIRICAIPNLPSSGEESNGGYGVSGANGSAVVNSRVSGAVYAMVQAAAQDGVKLTAISSFRTMSHQQALCPCDGVHVAQPGHSNHQMGLAIDFGGGLPATPGPIAGNQFWDWLSANAGKFGYKNYPVEAWHWSPTGN